jgi:hypothetical protein
VYVPLSEVLTAREATDAHFAAYSVPSFSRRLKKSVFGSAALPEGVPMVLAVFDVDAPGKDASEIWREAEAVKVIALLAAHADLFVYETRGGYRLVGVLSQPFVIRSADEAQLWSRLYREWCSYLREFGIEADTSCADWTRLYRLPHATRDGAATPEERPTIGNPASVGGWHLTNVGQGAAERLAADDASASVEAHGNDEDASDAQVERARAWAAAAAPSIEGQEGDHALFAAAQKLWHDYALSRAQAVDVLRTAFNPRCAPPWPDSELVRKVDRAATFTGYEDSRGSAATGLQAWLDGYVARLALTATANEATPLLPQLPQLPAKRPPFPLMSLSVLTSPVEPPRCVVDPVIRCASLTLLGSYGGSGKTMLAIDAAISVAAGIPWMGTFRTFEGRALYLDYENGEYEMRRRFQAIAKGRGSTLSDRIAISCMPGTYMTDGSFEAELASVCEGRALVIVDTLKAANPGTDENDSNIRAGLDSMRRVAESTGAAFMVLVHSKKVGVQKGQADPREASRGSSAIFDAADTVLQVQYEKGQPLHIQQTKARFGRTIEPLSVAIDDTPDGGIAVRAVQAPDPSQAEKDEAESARVQLRVKVLAFLQANPNASARLIAERVHARPGSVGAMLEELERERRVSNGGSAKKPQWFVVPTAGSQLPYGGFRPVAGGAE